MRLIIAPCILAIAAIMPSAGFAGASTSTGSASLMVVNQCSISGAIVNLGTYLTSQTWGDVATATGWYRPSGGSSSAVPGPLSRTLNMGSVTCDAGIPYTFTITGSGAATVGLPGIVVPFGAAVIFVGSTPGIFEPLVSRVGSQVIADEAAFSGSGLGRRAVRGIAGVGSGTAQQISGTMVNSPQFFLSVPGRPAIPDPVSLLAVPGVYTNTLMYQLDF